MALLSSETKTANGTIAIPNNCTVIVGLVKGSVLPPEIAGVAMETLAQVAATTNVKAVSIHQYKPPADDVTVAFTMSGDSVHFVYISAMDGNRPGAVFGNAVSSVTGELPTSATDLVLAIMSGMIGPCTLKGDTVEMTYLVNETFDKVGWIVPGDASLTALATDAGVSAGYYIDGGSVYHPSVLITAAYTEYVRTQHTVTYKFSRKVVSAAPPVYYYWNVYIDGVWNGQTKTTTTVSAPSSYFYYSNDPVDHEAVYSEAYTEDLPDIWVPGGEAASLSACFVSIRTSASSVFVGRPMFWG